MQLRHWVLIILGFILLILTSVFLLRKPLLEYAVDKASEKALVRYNAVLEVGDAGFAGLTEIYLDNIRVTEEGSRDTLVFIHHLQTRLRLRKLLSLSVGFHEIEIDTARITMINKGGKTNYGFLLKSNSEKVKDSTREKSGGFNELFNNLYGKVHEIFDENITLRNIRIFYTYNQDMEMVSIPELYFENEIFQASVITSSLEGVNLWLVKGNADVSSDKYNFKVERVRGEAFALPFIDLWKGIKICFDQANVKFSTAENEDVVPVSAEADFQNLLVNYWRVSPDDVLFPRLLADIKAGIAKDSILLHEGSSFTLNDLPLQINGSVKRSDYKSIYAVASFKTDDAQDLFSSLPEGMFRSFRGFEADGKLDFKTEFSYRTDQPDSLLFDSYLKSENFRIVRYGNENFSKIANPFSFLAMDGERPVRSFEVGPGNPMFTPLELINPYLQNAVLTAEDPSFFNHNGFLPESFRESMITNLKEGRFARGGSTISMQLVKNIYLSRNKTIARKLEEALIVWLIEKNRLVSKERMFEVYLNIIEWGPDVYGIGEASRFYFAKTPMELNLEESIFLASIIPHPKYFRYRFDAEGNLKPYMENYFKLVAGRMARREKILQHEADSIKANVRLVGMARDIVIPPGSEIPDSSEIFPVLPR